MMSFLRRAATNIVTRDFDASGFLAIPPDQPPPPWMADSGLVYDGGPMGDNLGLKLIDVYACVSLIADAIAMMPWGEYTMVDGAPRLSDTQPPILNRPHPENDAYEWKFACVESLLLRGDTIGTYVGLGNDGWPTGIQLHHPDDVFVERNRQSGRIEYTFWNYDRNQESAPLSTVDVFHIKGFVTPGALRGISVLSQFRHAFFGARMVEEYGRRYFKDSATPSGVLETDQAWSETSANIARETWLEQHQGRRLPAVLSGGLKWRQIMVTPEESQFLGTRELNTTQIVRLFRVPPHLVGDVKRSTSWGSGLEEQGRNFVTYTLLGWMQRLQNAMSAIRPRPRFVQFDPSFLERGNMLTRYQAYAIARMWGWMNSDDVRARESMAPLVDGGGQDYLQPANYVPVAPPGDGTPSSPTPTIPPPDTNPPDQPAQDY